jgi:hypothetical protein
MEHYGPLIQKPGDADAFALGGSSLSGTATVTLPYASELREWTQTVAAAGVVPSNSIIALFAPGTDADENIAEWLVPVGGPVAVAGTDEITFTLNFQEPTSGPILLNWRVF